MKEIRRAVVIGTLKPGDKLTENGLAASLNVSRPTMREALAQLAQEGLLIQEPYRGLRVAVMEPQAIMDIATARVALDLDTLAVQGILADRSGASLQLVRQAWTEYNRLPSMPTRWWPRGTHRVSSAPVGGVRQHAAAAALAGHRSAHHDRDRPRSGRPG